MGDIMFQHKSILLALSMLTLSATGCHHAAFSPPSRYTMSETARVPDKGEQDVDLSAAMHSEVLGTSGISGSASYARGVTENLSLSARGGVYQVTEEADHDLDRHIYAGRIGAKYTPDPVEDYIAVQLGLGGGTSSGGEFLSPDIGLHVSYPIGFFEPYVHGYSFLSAPFNTRPINYVYNEESYSLEAQTTYGLGANGGFALNFTDEDGALHGHQVRLGFGVTQMERRDGDELRMLSSEVGYQVSF